MTLSKEWINQQIDLASKSKDEMNQQNKQESLLYQGMILAYQNCMTELTKPPTPRQPNTSQEPPDWDKIYQNLVRFYIDKKNYDVEHANKIAMNVINAQKQALANKR